MFRILLFLGFSLAILCLPSEGHAFLDKLTKELQKNLPSPTQGNNNPQNQTKNSSSGSSDTMDYKSPAILKFLCDKTDPPGLPTSPPPNEQLVAADFGKSVEVTKKILFDNFVAETGPVWSVSIPYYKDAFQKDEVTDAKRLFDAFVASKGANIGVLSQLKQIADQPDPMSSREKIAINEARFAYGIILSHYTEFHKKTAYVESLIDNAYHSDQIGALYYWGKRNYYGWGVTKNVNKAANIISPLASKGVYERADQLWLKIALDPGYKYRDNYASLAKKAKKIDAAMKREMSKKTGSVLRKRVDRLNNVRIEALKKLAKAFDVAKELGKILSGLEDLKNVTDPTQQQVEKNVRVGEKATALIIKISEGGKKLDPEGQKLLKEAMQMNRMVISQLGATTAQFMTAPTATSSLLSDMVAMAPAIDRGIKASCKLDTGMVAYAEKQNFEIPQDKIQDDPEDEMNDDNELNELNNAG